MPLRAVFLDIGETLITTLRPRFEIYAAAAETRGRRVTPERMRELMVEVHRALPREIDRSPRYSDPWFREFIGRVFGEELGFDGEPLEEITEELFDSFQNPRTFRIFPGTDALFTTLRERKLVTGVVSNWSARLPRLLEALGWTKHFDFVVCSAIDGVEKPRPEIFEEALRRAKVPPEQALHAGDDPRLDAEAARRVGIVGVLVDHGIPSRSPATAAPDAPAKPFPTVHGLDGLRSYILDRTS
jgi:putative hydrolase of the HAD superfamily